MVDYPLLVPPDPRIPPKKLEKFGITVDLNMFPGEGINAAPFEARSLLDFTFNLGGGTGMMYGILFQLGKWGYEIYKVNNVITVTPMFTEYYQKTIEEKRKLEEQMKAEFASLTTAISDYELLVHDLRKYKEYLDYFKDVEIAKTELEDAKKKNNKKKIEEAEEKLKRAKRVLRAMFVDLVDAHTGEGISMKTIAVRWPTIITDFMTLSEDYDDPDEIRKALGNGISKAEATILATKCKLFKEWLTYFYGVVKERYTRLKSMSEARRKSIEEYRNAMKPLITRYREIKDMTTAPFLKTLFFFRPDSQAVSIDETTIWAWRPFISPDIFRPPRETYDRVTFKEAGFYNLAKYYVKGKNEEEKKKEREKIISQINQLERENKTVPPLPALPIIDRPLIAIIRQIELEYNVEITPEILYEHIKNFSDRFVPPDLASPTKGGIRWPFSPYFVFVEMTVDRTVIKMPSGEMIEDIWIEPLKTYNSTQNIILGRKLELWAKTQKEERDIELLLGIKIEQDNKFIEMNKIGEEDYPEVFLNKEERNKNLKGGKKTLSIPRNTISENIEEFGLKIAEFLRKLGIDARFFYPGPYEKLMSEKMTKMMQLAPGRAHGTITEYLKKVAGVPGAEPKVWI